MIGTKLICPFLETGGNGEYRCYALSDNDAGYYTETYLGDNPNKECKSNFCDCAKFIKRYKENKEDE